MMDRQGAMFCAAILLTLSGAGLYCVSSRLEGKAAEDARSQAERDIRTGALSIYRVTVNDRTGVTTLSKNGNAMATFPNSTKLMQASMPQSVGGTFLAQRNGTGEEGATCEVWRLGDRSLTLRKESWPGECFPDEDDNASHFWLTYVPFGSSEKLSVPVSYDMDASGRHSIEWGMDLGRETFQSRYGRQAERLMQDVQDFCKEGGEPRCHSACRALTFMVVSSSGMKGAAAFADQAAAFSKPAGDFVREILEDVQSEVEALRRP